MTEKIYSIIHVSDGKKKEEYSGNDLDKFVRRIDEVFQRIRDCIADVHTFPTMPFKKVKITFETQRDDSED